MQIDKGDVDEAVVKLVERRNPGQKNYRISNRVQKFLKGTLYFVTYDWTDPATGAASPFYNVVYAHGKEMEFFWKAEELLAIVGPTHEEGLLTRLTAPTTVASIIAISVTLVVASYVVAALAFSKSVDLPESIANGFLIILGFYFGRAGSTKD